MTLRDIAIVIAVVLALPGVVLILRDARAAFADATGRGDRVMHVVWTAVPVLLLVVLGVCSVVA